ncbi:MAG: hypothetical protein IJJ99_05420 [Oscillospiraceae bacterium]|nr:hypothetical protein [Oscillospiraceae bacterium]
MKAEINQTPEAAAPYAVIYCREIDGTVLSAAEGLWQESDFVAVYDKERIAVIKRKTASLPAGSACADRGRIPALGPHLRPHPQGRKADERAHCGKAVKV